jgi:hypothetical protein
VVSSELASYIDEPVTDLGEFELKGVPGKPRVYGLDPTPIKA